MPKAQSLLAEFGVNRVGADPDPIGAGVAPSPFGACRYWRLHGSPRMYYSAYDDLRLGAFAGHLDNSVQTWVIFDNTAAGYAVHDALILQDCLGGDSASALRQG